MKFQFTGESTQKYENQEEAEPKKKMPSTINKKPQRKGKTLKHSPRRGRNEDNWLKM